MKKPTFPRAKHDAEVDADWAARLVAELDGFVDATNDAANTEPYLVDDVEERRELNAPTATLEQVSHTLGTLILDLKKKGVLR